MATHRVLIIDDDKDIVALVSGLLRGAGYQTLVAFDAMQGTSLATREQPALILLDLQLPAGGGFQVLDRLGSSIRTRQIPVLVLSASTQAGIDDEVRRKGAIGFLAKPIDRTKLLAAVAAALG